MGWDYIYLDLLEKKKQFIVEFSDQFLSIAVEMPVLQPLSVVAPTVIDPVD